MIRNLLAVVAGYVAWTAVFLGGSTGVRSAFSAVHDAAGMTSDVMALSLYLVLSVVASMAGGFLTGRIASPPARKWVWGLAAALLATGIPVQLSSWDQLPVWYNVAFLVLLVPATLMGGRAASHRSPA